MAKSKKKKAKVKRMVGSTAMDVVKEPVSRADRPIADSEGMDTSEIVVTDSTSAPKRPAIGAGGGRIVKKGPQKRKALKLRKERALMRAISIIDKQERRVTKQELKKFGKQELKKMD